MTLAKGTAIASYVVERELGAGGTGTVYLCRHMLIDRDVAVKVLHDDQALDRDAITRFFQEAKAAADIGHPNIITIIDFGTIETEHGPRAYIMMEALDGESLDKRLRKGGLSLDDIARILEQICSALTASHGKGIVHRDLKPPNVFLCRQIFDPTFVKLLDFGTAKLAAPAPGGPRTQMGMVLGTPAYMSPEQCEGRGAIDHRSDIYSLGVMLYEMLTGALPFSGEIREIMLGHLRDTPAPPRARNPAIPPEWEALCLRMMEKQKAARFQSITEVAQALADLRGHALAYGAYVEARASSGHSGATQLLPADAAEAAVAADRDAVVEREPDPQPHTLDGACAALGDAAAFVAALLARLEGRWFEVTEVCKSIRIAAPIALPRSTQVTWIQYPGGDLDRIALVFLDARSGWGTVVPTARASARTSD